MQFLYKKFKLADGTELFKPIIPIGLLFNGKLIRYEALIDSGADFNIFNAEIGELLGRVKFIFSRGIIEITPERS